ncbi:MAG: EMC3/TMCO1 family protein [Candidatus Hermodarchaeota archaeon]
MSNGIIVIQIMFITIGMVALGMVLNYILGLKKEVMKDLREKALNLQERMRNAQAIGDFQQLTQLQRESILFMKQMMKKQFVPMCIRCMIFIGIFIVLGFIYSDYNSGLLPFPLLFFGNGWVAIYIIFSISFSLIIFGVQKLYKRITGKETRAQSYMRDIIKIISPSQQESSSPFQISTRVPINSTHGYREIPYSKEDKEETSKNKSDSWKDRIEK